jgi:hypothetical protein
VYELHVKQRRYRVWQEKQVDAQCALVGAEVVVTVWKAHVEQPLRVNGRHTNLTEVHPIGTFASKRKAMAACRAYQKRLPLV